MRSYLSRLAIVTLSSLGSLLLGEALLRTVTPIPKRRWALYEYDSILGWKHRPGISEDVPRADGRTIRIDFNERGYRGPILPVEKPAGVRRIVIIGDSFTEALDVPWAQAFPTSLNVELLRSGIGRTETLALGTSSYGTVHEFLVLRNEAMSYAPDLTILQMSVNDFWDNVKDLSYQRRGPWASLTGPAGSLTISPPSAVLDSSVPAYVPWWRELASHLKWNSAIAYRLALLIQPSERIARAGPVGRAALVDPRTDHRFADAKRVTCVLIKTMRDLCERQGVRFAVYINPSTMRYQVPDDARQIYLGNGRTETFRLDGQIENWLFSDVLEYCRIEKITCVWSDDLFESALRDGRNVTVRDDPHWDTEGHRLVATDLAKHIPNWLD
jgi:lysophospholipase L1-like esterase